MLTIMIRDDDDDDDINCVSVCACELYHTVCRP